MTKLLYVAFILLYFGVGIIAGSAVMFISGDIDTSLSIGGIIALIAAGIYAVWQWKYQSIQQINQHDEIVDIARTALGVNYSSLQTSDPQEFVKARDAVANLIANKVIAQKSSEQ